MFSNSPTDRPDPIIEYYKQFVDREALRENLRLTLDERFERLHERARKEDQQNPPRPPLGPDQPWAPVSDCGPNRTTDPIIELYKRDVDCTLLRENLRRTVSERLDGLRRMAELMEAFQADKVECNEP
jgi:hypothetical protein